MNPIQLLVTQTVKRHGLSIQFIFPTVEEPGPKWAYTIGMTDLGHPELLVFGLPEELAGMVFNRVYAELKGGIRTGHEDLIENVLSVPLLIHQAEDSLVYPRTVQGQVYYSVRGTKPVYKQVIWPDQAGVYPHQQGFDPQMKPIQPYLCMPCLVN